MACFLIKGLQVRQSMTCYSQKALASSLGEWGSARMGRRDQKRGVWGSAGLCTWVERHGELGSNTWGMVVKYVGNGGQSLTKNACKIRFSLMHRHRSCCLKALLFKSLVVKQQRENG